MYRMVNYEAARIVAEREHLAFGLSVVAPEYFVGSANDLGTLPVVVIYDYGDLPARAEEGEG